jgi:hypothetical protein
MQADLQNVIPTYRNKKHSAIDLHMLLHIAEASDSISSGPAS